MLQETLTALIEPVVEALGYELLLLEFHSGRGSAMLRLFIDAPGGIGLQDCERVSREVSGVLDVEDPIKSAYRLEVSSPGMDRPLVKPGHYERFIGEQAKVQLMAPKNGRRRFAGSIRAVSDSGVRLETAEGPVELEFSEIERARLVPSYEQESSGS